MPPQGFTDAVGWWLLCRGVAYDLTEHRESSRDGNGKDVPLKVKSRRPW